MRARIVEIRAGNRMTRRCLALGLRVGAELTVSHKRGRGVVAASDGNRVALGADTAERLLVERLD
ncbi:MAG: ferrous iron transport protein A [Actinomycetia bacterium]|nr:ferrous iron transport protein A [Actinomycetes bacterium]MCP4225671.1 ferrous iron transport protein A [Actinomycetes bacterium]MCP5033911.1 ferrous iron transport protein A [Actinomycetes bacterium]